MAQILSTPGGKYEISEEYHDLVCVTSDGDILVSKDSMTDPYLRSYIARVSRGFQADSIVPRQKAVELSVIRSTIESVDVQRRAEDVPVAQMQREAISMFEDAVNMGASDIHIRVGKLTTEILYRVNGDLQRAKEFPSTVGIALCQSIYVTMTDVSDTVFKENGRQDARISDPKRLPSSLHGLRIATTPTVYGMLMVLRLLYNSNSGGDVGALGYSDDHLSQILMMMSQPYGINFTSGPTGSGKSTTLQRLLAQIYQKTQGKAHIITVEDPPEYPIEGAVQTPVVAESEAERGAAFRAAIRSAMRLDPDIIMIGEVRDLESAQLAVNASMTGHQVWTTIHANNAMAILDRLIEIGIPVSTLADPSLITGLIAQRLVKTVCQKCSIPMTDMEDKMEAHLVSRVRIACDNDISRVRIRNHAGCEHCKNTGIKGRTVIAEIIIPDATLCDIVRRGDRLAAVKYWLHEQKGQNMLQHCITKIRAGLIDPDDGEEVAGPLSMNSISSDDKIQLGEIRETLG